MKHFWHAASAVTKVDVVWSNLLVTHKETEMFALLPQSYPEDFLDFFIRNYFNIFDIFHKWLDNFDIKSWHD